MLAYTQTTFHEAVSNDGSFSSERAIDVFGTTWAVRCVGRRRRILRLQPALWLDGQAAARLRQARHLVPGGRGGGPHQPDDQDVNVSFNASLLSETTPDMSLNGWMTLDLADPYGIEHVIVDPSEGIMVANPGNNWKYFDLGVGDAEFGLWYVNNHFRFETYSKSGVCNAGSTNLAALQAGAVIGEPSNWEYFTELETQLVITSPSYSDWDGQIAYAGFKFTIAERFHYGWMMFEVAPTATWFSCSNTPTIASRLKRLSRVRSTPNTAAPILTRSITTPSPSRTTARANTPGLRRRDDDVHPDDHSYGDGWNATSWSS